jgi:hypothetical protein
MVVGIAAVVGRAVDIVAGTAVVVVVAAGGTVGEVGGKAVGGDCRSCHSPIAYAPRKRLISFLHRSISVIINLAVSFCLDL